MLLAEVGERGQNRMSQIAHLIECGTNINCRNPQGNSAIYLATTHGRVETVAAMVAAKANLNFHYGRENETLLHIAIHKKHLQIIELLLNAKASMKLKNKSGASSFDCAMSSGDSSIVHLFNQQQGKMLLSKVVAPVSILKTSHSIL